ncbi:MAG: ATP-grasp domain-containing protein [Alcaligenaceae bacterium]|nr:ATP-grasp domain-containing protein [Alcaligenaceae bacterium]
MTKVLIANRGEIAVRIARACRDYGVRSVAVYADPDADALHVRAADEAWALQGSRPAETYLDIAKLIGLAHASGADAVHPGYGFLSERAEFARAVQDAGLTWIGPDPATIEALGDKVAARKIALQVGAPLVVGTAEPVKSSAEVLAFAEEHGLPIAIKAAHGGGGRGLKVAWRSEEVAELYESAVREATAAFGRGECFLEQFLDRPRHIEAQVLADRHGNVVVVGTRDCSLQRRNQKLVEEAPAPFLSDEQRARIHQSARDICAAAGYVGAGTVEFLLSRDGQISFLEVNTRLQVEHPVTEETAGIDLVIEQLRIADGLPLSFTETPPVRGHSFEFRINAEDPGRGYLPTPGLITRFEAPSGPGVRVDTGVTGGSMVPGSFDSLMAKLIVTGATRQQALARARRALQEFTIEGVASVLPFHRAVVNDPAFHGEEGLGVHTRWIETEMSTHFEAVDRPDTSENMTLLRTFIEIDGKRVRLGLPSNLALQHAGANPGAPAAPEPVAIAAPGDVPAPLSGSLVAWKKADGDTVAAGEIIAVMEAMKMETSVHAPYAGTLECLAKAGETVASGQLVGRIRAA